MSSEILVDRAVLAEIVTHVETLVKHHDGLRGEKSQTSVYAASQLKSLLSQHPFNGERFILRRSWTGRYRIWDANRQGYWSGGIWRREWSTREKQWALEKVRHLNDEHKKQNAPWREEPQVKTA